MTSEVRDILFIDIETVAVTNSYWDLDERMKTQWARKANFFKQRAEGITDEGLFHERAGIYAEFGKIIVIGVGRISQNEAGEAILKVKALQDNDEKALLETFKNLVEKMDPSTKLCAHNGREFDFPYLSRRMLINGVGLPSILTLSGRKPWEVPHIDTMELWKFGDYKHFTSLDLLAALFGIPTSKTSMDGSQVNDVYYKENNINKIAEYCKGDVIAVAQIYLKMKGLSLIPPERILQV